MRPRLSPAAFLAAEHVFVRPEGRSQEVLERFLRRRKMDRQIAVHTTWAIVRGMHARTRNRLIAVQQIFALTEAIQEDRHCTDVETMRSEPHQVIQDTRDLIEHDADVLRTDRHLNTEQFLDRKHIGVLVAHHGAVIETIHVRHRLQEGAVLGQLFRGPVQQSDMRIGTHDRFAVQLQHQTQYTVRGRVLRTEIHCVIANVRHVSPC